MRIITLLAAILLASNAMACEECDRDGYCVQQPCSHIGHTIINGKRIPTRHLPDSLSKYRSPAALKHAKDCDCCVRSIEKPLGATGYEPAIYTTRHRQMSVRQKMGEEWWKLYGDKVR
jgi:hypothetical protein